MMKIEVWSDYVCPFCYLGKRYLERALEQFEHRDEVEVSFKAFELDPNHSGYDGQSVYEMLATKYNMSIDEAKRMNEQLGEQVKRVGLHYNFDEMKVTNTFDAHRLAKFAAAHGKDVEAKVTEKLLYGYFTESKLISDVNTLLDIAVESGMNVDETTAMLLDRTAFASDVRKDEQLARQIGITGVPFFVVNHKYTISGARPAEQMLAALQRIWEEQASSA